MKMFNIWPKTAHGWALFYGFLGAFIGTPDALMLILGKSDVVTMVNLRAMGAGLMLLLAARWELGHDFMNQSKMAIKQMGYYCVLYALGPFALIYSYKHISAASVLAIGASSPLLASFFAVFIIKQKLNRLNVWAMGIMFIGIFIVAFNENPLEKPLAILTTIFVAMHFALLFVMVKKYQHINPCLFLGLCFIFLAIVTMPFADYKNTPTSDWWIMLTNGVVVVGLCFYFMGKAGKHIRPEESIMLLMIENIVGPLIVFWGVGQVPSIGTIYGGIIILAVMSFWTIAKVKNRHKHIENNIINN